MSYSYYPSSSGSGMEHVSRPAAEDGRGSFGPVLVVLAVISFLSLCACIAGRVCGRGPSSRSSDSDKQQDGATEAENNKGLGASHVAAVMRPVPSSRATVHDFDDDAFEIKLLPPPANPGGTRGGTGPQAPPQERPGLPRQFVAAAVAAGAAGFRGPPQSGGNGASVVRPAQQLPPAVRGGVPFLHPQRCK